MGRCNQVSKPGGYVHLSLTVTLVDFNETSNILREFQYPENWKAFFTIYLANLVNIMKRFVLVICFKFAREAEKFLNLDLVVIYKLDKDVWYQIIVEEKLKDSTCKIKSIHCLIFALADYHALCSSKRNVERITYVFCVIPHFRHN